MPLIGQALAPPLVQTGNFLSNRAKRLHSMLLALNSVVTHLVAEKRMAVTEPKYLEWKQFLADWGAWYKAADLGAFWSMSADDATLEGYERSGQGWQAWLRATYPSVANQLPQAPPTFPPSAPFDIPPWLIVAGLAAGGFVLYKVTR